MINNLRRRRRVPNIGLTGNYAPAGLGAICASGAQRRTNGDKEIIRLKQLLDEFSSITQKNELLHLQKQIYFFYSFR